MMMMNKKGYVGQPADIAVYTLTSSLHDEVAVNEETRRFLAELAVDCRLMGDNYEDFGRHSLSLLYVRTGGTEGIFKQHFATWRQLTRKFYLLTSGKSNSLAASMEILSFLRQQGAEGEILHGPSDEVAKRIVLLAKVEQARKSLRAVKLGIIGKPSDWLISSSYDAGVLESRLGIQLKEIDISELIGEVKRTEASVFAEQPSAFAEQPSVVTEQPSAFAEQPSELSEVHAANPSVVQALPGALRIYHALRKLLEDNHLQGFTLRCFDLLGTVHNTGCMALARLNSEGYVAGCEGDVPAMISMMVARALTGVSGFQANPARINPQAGEMLFAHCTIPFDMVRSYELDTHFESGIGVGIRGYMNEGPVTIFKLAGDLSRMFVAEGMLVENRAETGLCRTQQVIRLADAEQTRYFLTNPIENHHIIIPGHQAAALHELLGL